MDGNVIALSTEYLPERRETVVTEIGSEYDWSIFVCLYTWCFAAVYGKDQPYDPIITPVAMVQVVLTLLVPLCLLGGAWGWALGLAAAVTAVPLFGFVIFLAVWVVLDNDCECGCGCGMH